MGDRTRIWLAILTATLFYEGVKIAFGFDIRTAVNDGADAVYWSGMTLVIHWLTVPTPLTDKEQT